MGMEALLALDRFGLLTNHQIASYLFQDRPNRDGAIRTEAAANLAANRYCLIRLKDAELIRRLPVILRSPRTGALYQGMVNVLTKAGADTVVDYYEQVGYGTPRWTRSIADLANQQLAHTMAINDVLIHLQRACWHRGISLVDWWVDRELAQRRDLAFGTVPDALVILKHSDGHPHAAFLEIDRGSETVLGVSAQRHDWRRRVGLYAAYLGPGGPYRRLPFYGGLHGQPLILTVTTTPARRDGMLAATQAGGGDEAFWYTTFAQLAIPRDPAALWRPIWRAFPEAEPRTLLTWLTT